MTRRLHKHLGTLLRSVCSQAECRTFQQAWGPCAWGSGLARQSATFLATRAYSAAKLGKQPAAPIDEEPTVDVAALSKAMEKPIERLQDILASVRVGRAAPGMLDHLKVDAYGDKLSLRSMASVSVRESQLLAVSAFDAQMLPAIEKAIRESALQLNPRREGQEVLVPVPRPNADTVKAMAKTIKQEGEATKVAIRLARKSVMEHIKKMPSKDAQRLEEKRVQKITDDFIKDVTAMCESKEQQLQSIS